MEGILLLLWMEVKSCFANTFRGYNTWDCMLFYWWDQRFEQVKFCNCAGRQIQCTVLCIIIIISYFFPVSPFRSFTSASVQESKRSTITSSDLSLVQKINLPQHWKGAGWSVIIEEDLKYSKILRKYYRRRTRVSLKQTAKHLQFIWVLVELQLCAVT